MVVDRLGDGRGESVAGQHEHRRRLAAASRHVGENRSRLGYHRTDVAVRQHRWELGRSAGLAGRERFTPSEVLEELARAAALDQPEGSGRATTLRDLLNYRREAKVAIPVQLSRLNDRDSQL